MNAVDATIDWYWSGLSDRALATIERHAVAMYDGSNDCGETVARWLPLFRAAGCDARSYDGNYSETEQTFYPASTDHVWMVVDGHIVDPTASQFGTRIDPSYYRTITD